jgi:hypothetical protein
MTGGIGLKNRVFGHFGVVVERELAQRTAGVVISNGLDSVPACALVNLRERRWVFSGHAEDHPAAHASRTDSLELARDAIPEQRQVLVNREVRGLQVE